MLDEVRQTWKEYVEARLAELAAGKLGEGVALPALVLQTPPKPEMGDIAFPLFAYAKALHMGPAQIAAQLKGAIEADPSAPSGTLLLAGPYLNIKLDMASLANTLYQEVVVEGAPYGHTDMLKGKKVMIEFSCPNTNKPLHLGHMRNDSLGSSVSEILKANGAEVMKVNLINNRGVHICKSMLAYQKFGGGTTPESTGKKGDHFVGDYYVRFATWEKEAFAQYQKEGGTLSLEDWQKTPESPAGQAQHMLELWEQGDSEVMRLWTLMNGWTLDGLQQSYQTMHIQFDKLYYESDTYKLGKAEVLKGLEDGVFYREKDGSVWVDLAPIGLDKKVLLRRDGTSLYMTQDIGTAITRHKDWPFDSLIYVVASEQQYHFKVLFYVLGLLGYPWAKELHHLSYGMVNLPTGKMKSREGTVVDADDLMQLMVDDALKTSMELGKFDDMSEAERQEVARIVGMGALKYFILKVDARKNMLFNPEESIDFNGNTGPFIQYTYARIRSILRKASQKETTAGSEAPLSEKEIELIQKMSEFGAAVEQAGKDYSPSGIANYCYELTKVFNQFYHDYSILNEPDEQKKAVRLVLAKNVAKIIKNGMGLLGIEVPERM